MFGTVVEKARASNQRRMVVTDRVSDVLSWTSGLSGLNVGWDRLRLKDFQFMAFSDTDKALGQTYENLVIDLRGSFSANDLAKIVPSVKGGGVIILLTPPFMEWATKKQKYHERLVSPPFRLKDARNLFVQRFIKKLYEFEGIWIKRDGKFEKESKDLSLPKKHVLNKKRKIHELCATQDQINFLDNFSEGINVLLANRGRGKSAALGMLISDLRNKKGSKTEVVVVSSDREKVNTTYEFLEKSLSHLDIPFGYKNGILLGKKIKVVFEEPEGALSRRADLFVVDEAASIPFSYLKELAKKENVVFSTTVHGYEGSGRIFSVLFLNHLQKKGYKLHTLGPSIRYAEGDPIESWLFDTLLLDAEPKKPKLKDLKFTPKKTEDLFNDEGLLRNTFGMLVLSHYRNTPNDLQILADAPHHEVSLIESDGILGVIQTAVEGGLSGEEAKTLFSDERPKGNLVPDEIYKHYGLLDFSKLKGKRIVRIVTHPSIQNEGVGSFGLENLKADDWVGASFGSESRLLNFWIKNGFVPVALGPYKNPVTGQYAVLVIKPMSGDAKKQIDEIKKQFELRFLGSISDVYWDMEPGAIRQILKTFSSQKKPEFSPLEIKRLSLFLSGKHVYEFDVDILTKLVKWYFGTKGSYLTETEELVLVSKVLQRAMWKVVKEKTGHDKVFETVKAAASKISKRLAKA